MSSLVFPKILFLNLSLNPLQPNKSNDLANFKIQISGEKTDNWTYDDLVLSVYNKSIGKYM